MSKKYYIYKDFITMKKPIPEGADINNELIKDCIAVSGMYYRNLKHMLIVDAILSKIDPQTYIFVSSYEKISKELDIAYSTVVRAFTSLIEQEIIERIGKGKYRVNPTLMKASVNALKIKYVKEGEAE